jgi:hypothetical protein
MSTQYGNFNLSVPLIHLHAPHFEWHRVRRPIPAALLAGAALLGLAMTAMAARDVPAALDTAPVVAAGLSNAIREASYRVEPTAHYRHVDRSVDYEAMYRASAPKRGLESMYATPRSQRD